MSNQFLIWLILFIFSAIAIYFRFFHPKKKFKDSTHMKNKNLLELEYNRLNQYTYHLEIIGFSLIIAGLTTLSQGTISGFMMTLGLLFLIAAIIHDGRAERRYYWLREIVKKK